MSTIHNQLYANLLTHLIYTHLPLFMEGDRNLIMGEEDVPPGMPYEPWMRLECKAVWTQEPMGRILRIHFLAGVEGAPFQEVVFVVCPEIPTGLIIQHPLPNEEYGLCYIFNTIAHWCIQMVADKEGLPSCCCPDRADDSGHHSHCDVPDYSVNDPVQKPEQTWKTEVIYTPPPEVPPNSNVLPFKPQLRMVPKYEPSKS